MEGMISYYWDTKSDGKFDWGSLLALINSRQVGFIKYRLKKGGTGEIQLVRVLSHYRSRGIGEEMYKRLEDRAKRLGVKRLIGTIGFRRIYGDPERAEVFWKRMGFTITGYDMEKELS